MGKVAGQRLQPHEAVSLASISYICGQFPHSFHIFLGLSRVQKQRNHTNHLSDFFPRIIDHFGTDPPHYQQLGLPRPGPHGPLGSPETGRTGAHLPGTPERRPLHLLRNGRPLPSGLPLLKAPSAGDSRGPDHPPSHGRSPNGGKRPAPCRTVGNAMGHPPSQSSYVCCRKEGPMEGGLKLS